MLARHRQPRHRLEPKGLLCRPGARRLIRARDGNGGVLLLARRDWCVAGVRLGGSPWRRWDRDVEAPHRGLRRGGVDLDRGRLQREWLRCGRDAGLRGFDEAGARGVALFGIGERVGGVGGGWKARRLHVSAVGWGEGPEAGGVGRGLRAQLGEVEVRASFVADVHGLAELAFGVVAVEDDAIDDNGDGLDDDFDDAADKGPGLGKISGYSGRGVGRSIPEYDRPARSLPAHRRVAAACYRHKTSPRYLDCPSCSLHPAEYRLPLPT